MGWASLIITLSLGIVLPAPYDELTWSEAQLKRAERALKAAHRELYELDRLSIKADSDRVRQQIKARREAVLARFTKQLDDMLTAEQRLQLAELRQLWEEGVAMGGGYFRSPRPEALGHLRYPSGIFVDQHSQLEASRFQRFEETGIEFDVTNRSGQMLPRARFVAEAFDKPGGKRLDRVEFEVLELPDGGTERVRLEAEVGRSDHHWDIRFQPAP